MPQKLTEPDEVLYKQIHPNFYVNGMLGSPAFVPNPSDEGKSSSDRSSIASAVEAYRHYTEHRKKLSACVFGVSVEEYLGKSIICYEDQLAAIDNIPANPAHCLADYSTHEAKSWKVIAKRLRNKAVQRGVQYNPVNAA